MNIYGRNFLSKNPSYYDDTSLLLYDYTSTGIPIKYEAKLYSLSSEKNMLKFDWPNLYQNHREFEIYGSSVNGIFCIRGVWAKGIPNIKESGRHVLWNPTTDEYKVPLSSPFAFGSRSWEPAIDFYGFGYDQISDDYKVVRYVSFCRRTGEDYDEYLWEDVEEMWKDGCHESLWEIYSLKYNCWRKLDLDMPTYGHYCYGKFLQVNTDDGVCHWWSSGESEICSEDYLVSFNLHNETFVKTSIPMDYIADSGITRNDLIILNGSIGIISILGEVGTKKSWIKLFIVGPLSGVKHMVGIGKKGDIFFRKKDKELVCFNLNTQKIEELGVKGGRSCQIMIYKENFQPFERINN